MKTRLVIRWVNSLGQYEYRGIVGNTYSEAFNDAIKLATLRGIPFIIMNEHDIWSLHSSIIEKIKNDWDPPPLDDIIYSKGYWGYP